MIQYTAQCRERWHKTKTLLTPYELSLETATYSNEWILFRCDYVPVILNIVPLSTAVESKLKSSACISICVCLRFFRRFRCLRIRIHAVCVFGGPVRLHIAISCRIRLCVVHVLGPCVWTVYSMVLIRCSNVYGANVQSDSVRSYAWWNSMPVHMRRPICSEGKWIFRSVVRCVRYALQARACELSSVYVALSSFFCFILIRDRKIRAVCECADTLCCGNIFSFTYDFPRTLTHIHTHGRKRSEKTFNFHSTQTHMRLKFNANCDAYFRVLPNRPMSNFLFERFLFTFCNACVHVNWSLPRRIAWSIWPFAVIYPCVSNDCVARTLGHIGYQISPSSVCCCFAYIFASLLPMLPPSNIFVFIKHVSLQHLNARLSISRCW